MQLAAAAHLEAVRREFFDAERDIGIQLAEQTVTQMAGGDVLALLTGERAVVDHEVHRDGRLGNLLEGNRLRGLGARNRVADVQVGDAGNRDNRAELCLLHLDAVQTFVLVELADLHAAQLIRLVVVHNRNFLVHTNRTAVHLAHADAAHILVVVDCADQNLGRRFRIALRRRNVVDDGLKQRLHIRIVAVHRGSCPAAARRRKDERALELLIRCVEIHEELQHLVHDLVRTRLRAVTLVHTDDDIERELQRLL